MKYDLARVLKFPLFLWVRVGVRVKCQQPRHPHPVLSLRERVPRQLPQFQNTFGARSWAIAMTMLVCGWQCAAIRGQEGESHSSSAVDANSQDAARKQILESDRWKHAERHLNEWFSVQKIYTADEVAAMRQEFTSRVSSMSPRELERFLHDMEERLDVLTSPEAEDARQWLGQFMAVARNPEEQLGIRRPDVLNMTASQVRHELQRLQQVRDSRLQAQAAFDRTRGVQAQASRDVLAAREAKRAPATNRSSWPANTPRPRNQNVQRRDPLPPPFRPPVYTVSPWGTPIVWHP